MTETSNTIVTGASAVWTNTLAFLPKLGLFIVILVVGYFVAKWIGNLVGRLLQRVGFNRLIERGGIKRALDRTHVDASDIVCKIITYTLLLFVLQLAFAVFGPNPVTDIINRVIEFVPSLIVALLIVVISAAIAKGAKDILLAMLGGLSYGRVLANIAGGAILAVGIFAALSHLQIAPAIVNGLFYAALTIIAGSAVIAIGGGGILPMRRQWERAIGKIEAEAPRLKAEANAGRGRAEAKASEWKERAKSEVQTARTEEELRERSRREAAGQRYEPRERGRDRM